MPVTMSTPATASRVEASSEPALAVQAIVTPSSSAVCYSSPPHGAAGEW
jgi:hypothetical protein